MQVGPAASYIVHTPNLFFQCCVQAAFWILLRNEFQLFTQITEEDSWRMHVQKTPVGSLTIRPEFSGTAMIGMTVCTFNSEHLGFTPLPPKPYHHFAAIFLSWIIYYNSITYQHPHRCSEFDPAKKILTSKFNYLRFCNPTHKTETMTANRWELLIANHLDQSLWMANQKNKDQQSDHIYYTLL
jgi:hypothetical protein